VVRRAIVAGRCGGAGAGAERCGDFAGGGGASIMGVHALQPCAWAEFFLFLKDVS
jgi:hypothetical protein